MSDLGSDAGEAFRTAGHSAHDAVGGIGKKAGGLPKWAWGLIIVGGGIVIYLLISRSNSGASSAGAAASYGVSTDSGDDLPNTETSTSDSSTAGSSGFSNNSAWESAAVQEFGNGQYTPVQIQQALGDLQQGNPLSTAEQSIVNTVEAALGSAPESTPTPVLAPAAPATSTSTASTSALGTIASKLKIIWTSGGAVLYNPTNNKETTIGSNAQLSALQQIMGQKVTGTGGVARVTSTVQTQALQKITAVQ